MLRKSGMNEWHEYCLIIERQGILTYFDISARNGLFIMAKLQFVDDNEI